MSAGTATIRARVGDATDEVVVRVSEPRLVRLELTAPSSLRVGATSQLGARAIDELGQAASSLAFTWSSDRSDIASVDVNGLVHANRPGLATISAYGGGLRESTQLTVLPPPRETPPIPPESSRKELPGPWRTVAENQMRLGLDAYEQSLSARDAGRITTLYGNASGDDQRNRDALVSLMRDASRRLQASNMTVMAMQIEPTNAVAQFRVRLDWRTPFGANRRQTPTFVAQFRRNGERWEMTSCRIIGRPQLE